MLVIMNNNWCESCVKHGYLLKNVCYSRNYMMMTLLNKTKRNIDKKFKFNKQTPPTPKNMLQVNNTKHNKGFSLH